MINSAGQYWMEPSKYYDAISMHMYKILQDYYLRDFIEEMSQDEWREYLFEQSECVICFAAEQANEVEGILAPELQWIDRDWNQSLFDRYWSVTTAANRAWYIALILNSEGHYYYFNQN